MQTLDNIPLLPDTQGTIDKATKLFSSVVVKRYNYANKLDTPEAMKDYINYRRAKLGIDTLGYYSVSREDLERFPYVSEDDISDVLTGEKKADDVLLNHDAELLLIEKRKIVIDSYVEENDYYRELLGLPPISAGPADYLYIVGVRGVDPTIPIHELPIDQFRTFRISKIYDRFMEKYKDHGYLKYIGKGLDLIELRDAEEFEILYFEKDLESIRYAEIYNKERIAFMRTYFNVYNFRNESSYEASRIMELKMNAFINFCIDNIMNVYDRTQYTIEETKLIWAKYNLVPPPFMPTIQRDAITYLLNYLTINKGTIDIVQYLVENVFTGMHVHKHYMVKKSRNYTPIDNTIPTPEELYTVDYIKAPYDSTTPYDHENNEVMTYDEVVKIDSKWFDTSEIRNLVFGNEYNYITSKYISIDNIIDMNELGNRIAVLSRVIINNKDLISHLCVHYPETSSDETLFDLFTYVNVLIASKYSYVDVIPDSLEHILYVVGFKTPEDIAILRDWFQGFFYSNPKYSELLDDFPTITDNESFFMFLRKLERSMNIVKVLQELIYENRSPFDDKLLSYLERAILICKTVPELYHVEANAEGSTYTDYLREYSPRIFSRYVELLNRFNPADISLELDYVIKIIKDKFLEYVTENSEVVKSLDDITNLYSGMLEYLSKILIIFKGYSSDLLSADTILVIGGIGEIAKGMDDIELDWETEIQQDESYMSTFDMVYDTLIDGDLNGTNTNTFRLVCDTASTAEFVIVDETAGSYIVSNRYNDVKPLEEDKK